MKKVIKILVVLSASSFAILLSFYLIAYCFGEPDLNKNRYLKLYDDSEDIFYQSINDYAGHYVSLDDVSDDFLKSIVAIEDQRFYKHRGFDIIGIARAVKVNLTNQDKSQGASTITQQYARLLYLTNEKSWSRKIKEAFLTMQLETHLTKDEILEGYINNVYFGHGIYGIENAAKYFYGKSAKDLDLNESSMLAGVVNGPTYYSPLNDQTAARKRQSLVLDALINCGEISESQKESVLESDLNLAEVHQTDENISNNYYKDTVIDELEDLGFYTNTYLNQGLNVYTTFNQDYQKVIENSSQEYTQDSDVETASIVVAPYTSKILALTGGKDYALSQYNRATKSNRQIGSTIKPLLYYLALENGFTPTTTFLCEPTTFKLDDNTTYSPSNFNDKYAYQEITLAQAIAVSDNIYAVKTHLFLGEENLAALIKKFGLKDVKANASLALGTLNTNIYNLANMYNCLASEGVYNHLYTIEKITNDEGKILYEHQASNQQLLNQDTCLVLSQLLTSSFNDVFSTYLQATMADYQLDNINACKTGSTDFDNLAVAYNPQVLVASWVGYDDNREMTTTADKTVAKKVVYDVLNYTNENYEVSWYQPTDQIQQIPINPLTGDFDENGTIYWFKKE
ncbi:transglycosylase domain-containing protein [uncultured Thomasclavelia sp.]|uniref:transglycosylase domain-containing protein n=1 Tax=uncultured Thomasclavelia sp. TaxID=3025759 RepID=UPI0025D17379|nr:transglycosylase domain-containing protein [uncultured Thomasclavelia sp.]